MKANLSVGHEDPRSVPVMRLEPSKEVSSGARQWAFWCEGEADYLLMPSGLKAGPWKLRKVWHDSRNGHAIYRGRAENREVHP